MKISELIQGLPYMEFRGQDVEVSHITYDSRKVCPGSLFVAIQGYDTDGHQYISQAEEKQAACLLVEKPVESSLPQVIVEDGRKALAYVSAIFFNHPSKEMKVVGITGTKGKTTVSNLLYQMAKTAGRNPGRIGTNGVAYADVNYPIFHTTPESSELQEILRNMRDKGVDTVFMEVSSGGLKLSRVEQIQFDIGVFTNFSRDHIGLKEHANMEEYLYWKSTLFEKTPVSILNVDEKVYSVLRERVKKRMLSYGIHGGDIQAKEIVYGKKINEHTHFMYCGKSTFPVELCNPGEFSVYNALAVLAVGELLEYPVFAMQDTLKQGHVLGRIELLPAPDNYCVVLDYAHNGTSLEQILRILKGYHPRRLLCVMGSIGGRARLRRKELGDVAAKFCDTVILTTDNPDFEDPIEIIKDIKESFVGTSVQVYEEPNRAEAVCLALSLMEEGDILLLAGKGHEEYQLIRGEKVPYSDKEVVNGYFSHLK